MLLLILQRTHSLTKLLTLKCVFFAPSRPGSPGISYRQIAKNSKNNVFYDACRRRRAKFRVEEQLQEEKEAHQ